LIAYNSNDNSRSIKQLYKVIASAATTISIALTTTSTGLPFKNNFQICNTTTEAEKH